VLGLTQIKAAHTTYKQLPTRAHAGKLLTWETPFQVTGKRTLQELSKVANYAAMRVAICSTLPAILQGAMRGRRVSLADVLIYHSADTDGRPLMKRRDG